MKFTGLAIGTLLPLQLGFGQSLDVLPDEIAPGVPKTEMMGEWLKKQAIVALDQRAAELVALKVGPYLFLSMPGEPMVEYGFKLEEAIPLKELGSLADEVVGDVFESFSKHPKDVEKRAEEQAKRKAK